MSYTIKAVLSNASHPEYGQVTIGRLFQQFPLYPAVQAEPGYKTVQVGLVP